MKTTDKYLQLLPDKALTTGIGSLPHHNIDAALEYAFRMSLPFLPQIPVYNPWEFMITQALDGLPGLIKERDGSVLLDIDVWQGRARFFDDKLYNAFSNMEKQNAFEAFEPTNSSASCWHPFLWECEERKIKIAKIQITGPLTAQWALRIKSKAGFTQTPELATQIYKLVLARALAMSRKLQDQSIQPVLYFDEPGLFGLSKTNPHHILGLQELKILIQTLQKEGVYVGIHCCSNTDWTALTQLGLDILSIDTELSLKSLLNSREVIQSFLNSPKKLPYKLSFGIVPTSKATTDQIRGFRSDPLLKNLQSQLIDAFQENSEIIRRILNSSFYTPACGLALHTPEDTEIVLALLNELVSKLH